MKLQKRTGLHRKVLIRQLRHAHVGPTKRRRESLYGAEVKRALASLWELFDYPCGQRFASLLPEQVPRMRVSGQWRCTDEVAAKLVQISPKTIDRLLAGERRRLCLRPGPGPQAGRYWRASR